MNKGIEYFWDLNGFTPNDNQREAILHTENPLFLTAGPGSGKTRVLLWRTLNLLVYHDIKPEEIFLSTFTEKAALQLKEGLRSLLGIVSNETGRPFDISQMSLGTVHSICQKILTDRRFSDEPTKKKPPILLDSLGQYFKIYNRRFWVDLINFAGFEDEETAQRAINFYFSETDSYSRHYAVQNCISIFNRFSEECILVQSPHVTDNTLYSIHKMYYYYKKNLEEERLKSVDFALLQQLAYHQILSIPNAKNIFKHIIIDEYQDTNSIQEKIFFELAKGHNNICVVGDDDQALYRFRGATVENLVEFPGRCEKYLNKKPLRIDLDINYRSKKAIVSLYSDFMERISWKKNNIDNEYHRIIDKNIKPFSQDNHPSVVISTRDKGYQVYQEIAEFVKSLKDNGKIQDYNQVAFLFPAMKNSTRVQGLKDALEAEGINVYAPRAGRFLDVDESLQVFGVMLKIFDRPHYGTNNLGQGLREFRNWMIKSMAVADSIISKDSQLKTYIDDRKSELELIQSDYEALLKVAKKKNWNLKDSFKTSMIRDFANASNLSAKAKKNLTNMYFQKIIEKRIIDGNPFSIEYILNRTTSVDWSVLDLFYQIIGFKHFRNLIHLAEDGTDEGPVCNFGLISQYLARFLEEYSSVITASFLKDSKFSNTFFGSYLYAIYRLGESEYEDADDPFPKGRVPFITIHQSKGLEFPIVVLGSVYKGNHGISKIESLIREINGKDGEPLERIEEFDKMRMFYVALSRAQNLIVLPQYKDSKGASEPFKTIFKENTITEIKDFKMDDLKEADGKKDDMGKTYSYTSDFLLYDKCPRNYMFFKKYGFIPSRSQTQFFGSLVHQTIDDIHNFLIGQRNAK